MNRTDRFFRNLDLKSTSQTAFVVSFIGSVLLLTAWIDEFWKQVALTATIMFTHWFSYVEGVDDGERLEKNRDK